MLRDQSLAFFSCDWSKILGVMLGKFLYLSQEENGLPSGLAFHQSWSIRGEHLPSEVVTYMRWRVCVFGRVMKRICPTDRHSLSRQAGLEARTLSDRWISPARVPLEGFWIQWWLCSSSKVVSFSLHHRQRSTNTGRHTHPTHSLSRMAVLWTRRLYLQSLSCNVWSYCHASCSAFKSPPPLKCFER